MPEQAETTARAERFWNPYVAGVALGLVLLASCGDSGSSPDATHDGFKDTTADFLLRDITRDGPRPDGLGPEGPPRDASVDSTLDAVDAGSDARDDAPDAGNDGTADALDAGNDGTADTLDAAVDADAALDVEPDGASDSTPDSAPDADATPADSTLDAGTAADTGSTDAATDG